MDITSYLLGKKAGGGGTATLQTKQVEVTSNGSQNITADTGYDGLQKVELTTNVQPTLQTKSVSITSNGTTTVSKDSDYDGMTSVSVTTNVQPDLESKSITITENTTTTISPTTGKDGLSSVSVTTNVPGITPTGTISITQNGTVDVTNYASADVNVSGGTTEPEEKDVNFYDYDGTRLYSYTKTEFLALSSMPNNPTHDGLIAQGWNWILSDAKSYVDDYGILDVGQMYSTENGSTKIYISLEDGRLTPAVRFAVNGTATIDWGDNTTPTTITGTSTSTYTDNIHTYSQGGNYIITITSQSKIYVDTYFVRMVNTTYTDINQIYVSAVKELVLGNININSAPFQNYYLLKKVLISTNTTFGTNVGLTFDYCAFDCIVIPNTITSLEMNFFADAYLRKIIIPKSITSTGTAVFNGTKYLDHIILPNSITTVEQALFYGARDMKFVILPKSLTSFGAQAFYNCMCLSNLKIPMSITNIGNSCFYGCYGMKYYDFSSHTSIPTLGTNAFGGISNDCKIVVPDSLYDSWKAASNWSTYANKIISKSDWDALNS